MDSKCVFSPFLTGTLSGQADSPPGFPLGGVWESSSVTFPDHQGIQLSAMALKHSQWIDQLKPLAPDPGPRGILGAQKLEGGNRVSLSPGLLQGTCWKRIIERVVVEEHP